jgi:hypothetical protein
MASTMWVVAVALLVLAAAQPARACYTRVFSFGDSLADTGNYRFVFPNDTREPAMRLPYGETYFGNATGRYSNGRLIIDFIGTTCLFSKPRTISLLSKRTDIEIRMGAQRTRWTCRSCRRTGAGGTQSTLRAGPTSPSVAPLR